MRIGDDEPAPEPYDSCAGAPAAGLHVHRHQPQALGDLAQRRLDSPRAEERDSSAGHGAASTVTESSRAAAARDPARSAVRSGRRRAPSMSPGSLDRAVVEGDQDVADEHPALIRRTVGLDVHDHETQLGPVSALAAAPAGAGTGLGRDAEPPTATWPRASSWATTRDTVLDGTVSAVARASPEVSMPATRPDASTSAPPRIRRRPRGRAGRTGRWHRLAMCATRRRRHSRCPGWR